MLAVGEPASDLAVCSCSLQLWVKQRLFAPWLIVGNKEALLLQQEVGCAEATVQLLQEAAMTGAAWGAAVRQPNCADSLQQDGEASPAVNMQQEQQERLAASSSPVVQCNAAGVSCSDRTLSVPLDHKGLLLPVGPEGWAVIDDSNQLEQLLQCLEQRGVRERDLKTCLDKVGKADEFMDNIYGLPKPDMFLARSYTAHWPIMLGFVSEPCGM